jgi:hypothetical protein
VVQCAPTAILNSCAHLSLGRPLLLPPSLGSQTVAAYVHLSWFLSSPACYRVTRRGRRLTPSPMNNNHKLKIVNCPAVCSILRLTYPHRNITNSCWISTTRWNERLLARSWSTIWASIFVQCVYAWQFVAVVVRNWIVSILSADRYIVHTLYPPTLALIPDHKVKVTLLLMWGTWPDIYNSLTVTVLFFWAALSNERTGLYLYMLLVLASAVFLGSESLGTRDHI